MQERTQPLVTFVAESAGNAATNRPSAKVRAWPRLARVARRSAMRSRWADSNCEATSIASAGAASEVSAARTAWACSARVEERDVGAAGAGGRCAKGGGRPPKAQTPECVGRGEHLRRPHYAPCRSLRCGRRRSSHDPPGRSLLPHPQSAQFHGKIVCTRIRDQYELKSSVTFSLR